MTAQVVSPKAPRSTVKEETELRGVGGSGRHAGVRVESRLTVPCYLLPGPTRSQSALEPVAVSSGSSFQVGSRWRREGRGSKGEMKLVDPPRIPHVKIATGDIWAFYARNPLKRALLEVEKSKIWRSR